MNENKAMPWDKGKQQPSLLDGPLSEAEKKAVQDVREREEALAELLDDVPRKTMRAFDYVTGSIAERKVLDLIYTLQLKSGPNPVLHGKEVSKGLFMTQGEIGDNVDLQQPAVARAIRGLKSKSLITVDGDGIYVVNMPAVRRVAKENGWKSKRKKKKTPDEK